VGLDRKEALGAVRRARHLVVNETTAAAAAAAGTETVCHGSSPEGDTSQPMDSDGVPDTLPVPAPDLLPTHRVLPTLYLAELVLLDSETEAPEVLELLTVAFGGRDVTAEDVEAMCAHVAAAVPGSLLTARRAYELSVPFLRSCQPPAYPSLARVLRTLVTLCPNRDESLPYFQDALSLLKSVTPTASDAPSTEMYPGVEVEWLVGEAWNSGVYYYRIGKGDAAEQWMGAAVKLSRYLPGGGRLDIMAQYSKVLDSLRQPQLQ